MMLKIRKLAGKYLVLSVLTFAEHSLGIPLCTTDDPYKWFLLRYLHVPVIDMYKDGWRPYLRHPPAQPQAGLSCQSRLSACFYSIK